MYMKKLIVSALVLASSAVAMAQGARDFKLNEVYVAPNQTCDSTEACKGAAQYLDEYGEASSWIEIENTSYTTHDLRNCYLTTDKSVLDEALSAPERIAKMSIILGSDKRTVLAGQQRITFFADGKVNRGMLHLNGNVSLKPGQDNWIALYDGNGIDLLDSITVPANAQGSSYARFVDEKGAVVWKVVGADKITPNTPNKIGGHNSKVSEWKQSDPYGIAMSIIAMAIVFVSLILLYLFFHVFGWIINRMTLLERVKAIRILQDKAEKMVVMAKDGVDTKGIEMENYAAAIGLALHEYMGGLHDIESGIITIQHHPSDWENKDYMLRQAPERH
jgi:Na+-transporting methylmalonyl-CoA/oxaloacetate decarboxylase gamma subunit